MYLNRVLTAAGFLGAVLAIDNSSINGLSFVDTVSNQRLSIIGVDYQPGGSSAFNNATGVDVLSVGDDCLRDAVIMQQLGINTIRVYNVNPQTNHDDCMSIFNAAGIYVIIDVNTPQQAIDRDAPWTTYDSDYLSFIFSQVENFKNYPNLLAFFAGNEIINDDPSAGIDPPYIRAVVRDLKQYVAAHASRKIPVGYSAADVRDVLQDTWNYLRCDLGNGDTSYIDMFGLNSYSWCGASATYTSAGYDQLVAIFQSTNIPVFFSEYGCNQPAGVPRVFNEVQALYGTNMTVFNGGLVYEYSEDTSDYGLVTINNNGSVQLRQDFVNLQGQYNKLDKSLLTKIPSPNTNTDPTCATGLLTNTAFYQNWTIPVQPPGAATLITNGVTGAINGKLVAVTNLTPSQEILDVAGNQITGLKLNVITSGSNMPSGANTTAGQISTSTGSGSGGSGNGSSKKGTANTLEMQSGLGFLAVAVLTIVFGF